MFGVFGGMSVCRGRGARFRGCSFDQEATPEKGFHVFTHSAICDVPEEIRVTKAPGSVCAHR
jgi:hypothetical protein